MGFFDNKTTTKSVDTKSTDNLASPYEAGASSISHEMIKEKESVLTFMAKIRHRNLKSQQVEAQLRELTSNVLKAQNDHIRHQLELGLDKKKKEEYLKYQADIAVIDKEIVELSHSMAKSLVELSFDSAEESFTLENSSFERFQLMYDNGKITKQQFELQKQKIMSCTNALQNRLESMVSTILDNGMKTFEHTVQLFCETKIDKM
ncbi:hypothetical protein [Glaciecola sp. 1036]|uniref:hypothetical protein n=1 Tax=Alteromonadaceae TaxID=72275 RepID=UPI003D031480